MYPYHKALGEGRGENFNFIWKEVLLSVAVPYRRMKYHTYEWLIKKVKKISINAFVFFPNTGVTHAMGGRGGLNRGNIS